MSTPAAEVDIDEALIGDLLASQAPAHADRPLEIVAHGWDTVTARLGEQLAVRLPRRAASAALIVNEQCWLPVLAPRLDLDVPVPIFVGEPERDFPWAWSIVPWFEGTTAEHQPLDESQAGPYGEFLRRLHVAAPPEAPINPHRGTPVAHHRERVVARWLGLRRAGSPLADAAHRAIAIWESGAAAPPADGVAWGHGDLHVRNVLTLDHRLAAVIDWIDINAGDPATDLASLWMMFPPTAIRPSGTPTARSTVPRGVGLGRGRSPSPACSPPSGWRMIRHCWRWAST